MKEQELQLLEELYNIYTKDNEREASISFVNMPYAEKSNLCNSLELLKEYGYIRFISRTLGSWYFQITVKGIAFAENGFKKPEETPTIQGDNNILVTGANSVVSGNYNKISVDVANSELPDDCKELIENLLYELQNPRLTPEKRFDKIKSFISDITSGATSGVASTVLTVLLSSLFNHVS